MVSGEARPPTQVRHLRFRTAPASITADNTILSTQLADFNLRKTHKGNVRNATKKGLIPKLLDVINPF